MNQQGTYILSNGLSLLVVLQVTYNKGVTYELVKKKFSGKNKKVSTLETKVSKLDYSKERRSQINS
jgi:hypothetical protein